MDLSYSHNFSLTREYSLIGKSIAAQGTSFLIKELDLLLDAGQDLNSKKRSVKIILITHNDADHIKCICSHILNSNHTVYKPNIYCPNQMLENLTSFIDSFFKLICNDDYTKYCNLIGLDINQIIRYEINKSNVWEIKTFKCYHGSKPCLGYGLSRITQKLKDEYVGKLSEELIELKKTEKITRDSLKPLLFFATDTEIKIFKNQEIFKYPNIMIECTLLENEHQLENRKHIHWNNLRPIILKNQNINFITFHFSEQYTEKYISKFFMKEKIKNVRPYFCR